MRRNRRYLRKTQKKPFGLVVQSLRLASQSSGKIVISDQEALPGVSSPGTSELVGRGDWETSLETMERRTSVGQDKQTASLTLRLCTLSLVVRYYVQLDI